MLIDGGGERTSLPYGAGYADGRIWARLSGPGPRHAAEAVLLRLIAGPRVLACVVVVGAECIGPFGMAADEVPLLAHQGAARQRQPQLASMAVQVQALHGVR
jgi:hypothetical protein